jgi:TolB-like protein/DNA-binding winged helix-turn-helix (wHTH) protein/predicted Zn-dependent protease
MSAEIHCFEDFELDPNTYRLLRNGQPLRLERIPLELLCLLVDRWGQLVTREEILEGIWGKGVFIDSENAINTAVRKIRRALNDDADAPRFIVTISAKGYRFVAPVLIRNGELTANGKTEQTINGESADFPSIAAIPGGSQSHQGRYWSALLSIAGLVALASIMIGVWRLAPRGHQISASKSSAEPGLPSKPSIAVLPFTNLSGDREQEYFSDGITDDLITALSRVPGLFVIARASSFTYKGKAAKLQEVSRELGVKYVMEGSVRKAAEQTRITVHLADATTDTELWAESYDRPLRDVFAMQDEIVRRIVTTLNLQLALSRQGALIPRSTENLEAYDDLLRGAEYLLSYTNKGNAKARQMFEKAIELDPKYAMAYALLGYNFLAGWVYAFDPDPNSLEQALRMEQRAIALDDDSLAVAHSVLAEIDGLRGDYPQAVAEAQRSVALDPNFATGYSCLADVLNFQGNHTGALAAVEKAMRLDPRNRVNYLQAQGWAYTDLGRWDEAIRSLKGYLGRYPDQLWSHARLAVAYSNRGDHDSAQAETVEVERATTLNPNSAVGYWALAFVMEEQGRPAEDLMAVNRAIHLDPRNHNTYSGTQAAAYTLLKRWEEAVPAFMRYIRLRPGDIRAHAYLAVDYIELGRDDAARAEVAEALKLNPRLTVETVFPRVGLAHQAFPAQIDRFREDLRQAGLK